VSVAFTAQHFILTAVLMVIMLLLMVLLLQHLLLLLLVQAPCCCPGGDAPCGVSHGSEASSCNSRNVLQQQGTTASSIRSRLTPSCRPSRSQPADLVHTHVHAALVLVRLLGVNSSTGG
jgi:hypothetical protein